MPEVPATRTPADPATVAALMATLAPDLDARQRAYLLAHAAIETRRFRSLIQHNIGNISARDSGDYNFWRPSWYRLDDDSSARDVRLHELMEAGKEPSAFRAYQSLEAGVGAYLSLMRGRYATMLRASSPEEFVLEWRNSGYTPRLDVGTTTPTFRAMLSQLGGADTDTESGVVGWLFAAGALWALTRRG